MVTKEDVDKAKAVYVKIVMGQAKAYAKASDEAYVAWKTFVKLKEEYQNESNSKTNQ